MSARFPEWAKALAMVWVIQLVAGLFVVPAWMALIVELVRHAVLWVCQ